MRYFLININRYQKNQQQNIEAGIINQRVIKQPKSATPLCKKKIISEQGTWFNVNYN
ncbi:MAG: hypothetical protein RIQ94_1405 [Pseudomonadota bacterium]|jgi:hypothetical protein